MTAERKEEGNRREENIITVLCRKRSQIYEAFMMNIVAGNYSPPTELKFQK